MSIAEDQVFCLSDGHYCIVEDRTFGPWPSRGPALAGLATEQRRAAKRRATLKECRESAT